MSRVFNQLIAGHEAIGHQRLYRDKPYVEIHKMGSSDRGYFTPAEAREFARLLLAAADKVEED